MTRWQRHKHSNLVLATSILKIPSPTLPASINPSHLLCLLNCQDKSAAYSCCHSSLNCCRLFRSLRHLLQELCQWVAPQALWTPSSYICSFHLSSTRQDESNSLPASPVCGSSSVPGSHQNQGVGTWHGCTLGVMDQDGLNSLHIFS